MAQTGAPPFNPRDAVRKFAAEMRAWGLSRVTGDAYAGQTFRRDFEDLGITYAVSRETKSEIYDAFEPKLNAGEVELLDDGKLQEQLLTLVMRGGRIDHQPGDRDDCANAACGSLVLAGARAPNDDEVFVVPFAPTTPSLGRAFDLGVNFDNVSGPPGGWPAGAGPRTDYY